MLLPSLSKAKSKAASAACLNNLKQLELASTLYQGDNGGWFPAQGEVEVSSRLAGVQNSWVLGNPKTDRSDENIRRGTLFQYMGGAVKAYRCPSDQSKVVGTNLVRFRSYSLSFQIGIFDPSGGVVDPSFGGVGPRGKSYIFKDTEALRPAKMYSFVDVSEGTADGRSFATGYAKEWPKGPGAWWNQPTDRH